jgi:hypothetical protein
MAHGYANTPQIDTGYNNRIMDDSLFTRTSSMSVNDIQTFLNARVPVCDSWHIDPATGSSPSTPWVCLKDYIDPSTNKRASQIIYDIAQEKGVNPQVILVILQKEQSLITDTWPFNSQYKWAMGYGCPESQSVCDSEYAGLYNQIRLGVTLLRVGFDRNCGNTSSYPGWYVSAQWKKNATPNVDGISTRLDNCISGSLYNYTPHRPDSAYNLRQGTYYYGNYNFIKFFNDWFGGSWVNTDTYRSSYHSQSGYSRIRPGQVTVEWIKYTNTGSSPWYDDIGLSSAPAGSSPVHLGTDNNNTPSSVSDGSWGACKCRPAINFTKVFNSDGSLSANQHKVDPGQVAYYEIPFKGGGTGQYRQRFRLVLENVVWLNDAGTYLDVTVSNTSSTYQIESISYYTDSTKSIVSSTTVNPNTRVYVEVRARNTSQTDWSNLGATPVRVGTYNPTNSTSDLYDNSWIAPIRPAGLKENNIRPDQVGTFNFWLKTPPTAGDYNKTLNLLIENHSWMSSNGFNVGLKNITTTDTYRSSYHSQSGYSRIRPGQVTVEWIKYTNTGSSPWYDDIGLSSAPAGSSPVHLGTDNNNTPSSVSDGSWGACKCRPAINFTKVFNSDGSLSANQHKVDPGQVAYYEIPFKGGGTGQYRQRFRLVLENVVWLNDAGTYLDVTVSNTSSTYQIESISYYTDSTKSIVSSTTVNPNTRVYVEVRARNTSQTDWSNLGATPVRVGTYNPTNSTSDLYDNSWIAPIRPAGLKENNIRPDQVGTFNFWLKTPPTAGDYNKTLNLLIENHSWMSSNGFNVGLKVN